MTLFADLETQYNIPVVLYDVNSNGKSTHLREKNGHESFWKISCFINELEHLIEYLGRNTVPWGRESITFGELLLANFAATNPGGLERMIIAAAPASAGLHQQGLLALRTTLRKDT
ncbi:MAG: hypothetical protein Q9157_002838 [Trypethelium eluteriae]